MRTTLDLDDDLLLRAQQRFPPGTSKTTILEEGLRALLRTDARTDRPAAMRELIAAGIVSPASKRGSPRSPGGLPLAELLAGLDADRADR